MTKLRNYGNTEGTSDIGDYVNSSLDIQIRTFDYTHLGFQFSDFQLKSFVDPKPVEL